MVRYGVLAAAIMTASALCGGIPTRAAELRRNLPDWVRLNAMQEEVTVRAEFGEETVEVLLKDGLLTIKGADISYESDPEWAVCDCFIYDLDRDGCDEVLLHTWRRGSFADYQPFWREKENKAVYTEHLFVYEWDKRSESRLKPIWMSSQMPMPGKEIWTEDDSTVHIISTNGKESVWRWEQWGLVRQ